MVKTVFALICAVLISATLQFPASAAEIIPKPPTKADSPGGLSVTSTVGSYFFAGSEQRNATTLYGLKVGYEKIEKSVADSLGVEGTLNYFISGSQIAGRHDSGYIYRLDATYPFPIGKKWLPFVAVGIGGIINETPAKTNSDFLFNYGAGVKYFLQNYLALRVDARQLVIYEGSDIRNNYEVNLGLSYYFGKERVKKTAPLPVPEKKKIVVPEDIPPKAEEIAKPVVPAVTDKTAEPGQPVPATVEVSVSPVVKNELVKKVSIEFDNNSSLVKPEYYTQLNEIADILKSSNNVAAHIEGHADVTGKLAVNRTLSEQRAQNVRSSLIKSGVNPNRLSITAHGPEKPIADNATIDGRQKNRRVDVLVEKIDPSVTIKAEQELQNEADRIENARLAAEILAKSGIKAAIALQEVSGALPVDSNQSLSFEMVNQGVNTEEYLMTITAPKEFDVFLTRANIPDEKVTLLRLAPGETLRGNVLFRIPAGMVDGQKATVTVRAESTKYRDVFFQKESPVVCSAPLIRVEAKLSRQEVAPGEKLGYRLLLHNAGSLSARNLTVRLLLPPQVDVVGTPLVPFSQEAAGMMVFKVEAIESGSTAEITIDLKLREESAVNQELLWSVEVIDGTLQRRIKSIERASVVRSK
ncbi:MAG: OmpA family protein [Desulfuromonadaceae bacterium]